MAAAVQELLAARSVAAMRIGKSDCGAIRLRTMAAQLLGKSEDTIDSGDVERLFDVMTVHRSSAQRHVIIVDDAELLHAEVLAYLRLLRSIGIEPVPQFLFVGGPSFWTRAEDAAADVRDLITVRVDLEPLTATESRQFAELLLASSGRAGEVAFDKAAFERLVHASDGLIGRLVVALAGVAETSGDISRERVADDVSRSENDSIRCRMTRFCYRRGSTLMWPRRCSVRRPLLSLGSPDRIGYRWWPVWRARSCSRAWSVRSPTGRFRFPPTLAPRQSPR